MRDLNDVLRQDGGDAVRNVFDGAKVINGYTRTELEHAIKALPKGWMNADTAPINPGAEFWQGALGPGTGLFVGPSSLGKTTIACGLGYAFATGQSFFGRRIIEPMGVAHVIGESPDDIAKRYRAIQLHTDDDQPLPISWKQNSANLGDDKIRRALIKDLQDLNAYYEDEFSARLRVLFFDTVVTNWQFKDENSNPEWAGLIRNLQEFADAIEGLALAIHHPPKSGVGERGGGASRAGADYILTGSCDRNDETGEVKNRKLALTKHRNGETGIISAVEIKKVALGILDAFGQEITSIVAIPSDAPTTSLSAKKPKASLLTLHRAFDEALHIDGRQHEVFSSPDCSSPVVMAAPLEVVKAEFYRRWAVDETDEEKALQARKKAFSRILKETIEIYGRENVDGEQLIWKLTAH